jgi:hypothetical protein
LEPFIKANNAHSEVSVSPKEFVENEFYSYHNDVIQYKNGGHFASFTHKGYNVEVLWNVTQQAYCLVDKNKLRPLTVAEMVLYVNE